MRKQIVTLAAGLLLAQFSNGAFAQQATPVAWAGWARCQISVQGPGYTDQQTHTWTITDGAPTVQGAFHVYAGTWAVVGGGSLSRSQGTQTLRAQWATNTPAVSAPIAVFVRASDNRMFIQARHAQLRSAAAIQGFQQVTLNGVPQTPGKIAAEAFEWAFPVVAVSAPVPPNTNATATGSSTPPVTGSVGPMQPAGSQGTASCTWQFGQGSAAPAPPPTLTAQAIPTPGSPASTTPPANNPPGATTPPGNTTPPGTTTPPDNPSGARLVSISPTTVEQGAIGTTVTLIGQGTHWSQAQPTVVVAPDIGVPIRNAQATSDTELLAQFDVQYAAVPGPRTITVTAGPEVVSIPNAFTVTARARPELVSVTPNRARQGERNLTVRLTGRNTRWAQGATRVQVARSFDASQPGTPPPIPGVTVVSTTVHSSTSASAVLNVEANAVVGAYWFQVYDAAPSDWLKIIYGFTVETGTPTGSASITPGGTGRVIDRPPSGGFTASDSVPAGPPRDPTNFTARQTGDGEVELRWDAVSGVANYVVLGAGASEGLKVSGTSVKLTDISSGQHQWVVTSWYEPDGSRTTADKWPRATATIAATKGNYRVIATRVVIDREEPDDPQKLHGRNNEIFVTARTSLVDRRDWRPLLSTDFARTAVFGDTANSGPNGGTRIRAGTVAQSGGIRGGDDIRMQFVAWTGELRDAVDALLLRPAVWVFHSDEQEFYRPYTNRPFNFAEGIREVIADRSVPDQPEIRAAVTRNGLAAEVVPGMTLNGRWSTRRHRPMGMAVSVNDANDPDSYAAIWMERVVVITREKVEQALARDAIAAVQMHVNGNMTGALAMPLGAYTLHLTIERVERPATATRDEQVEATRQKFQQFLRESGQDFTK